MSVVVDSVFKILILKVRSAPPGMLGGYPRLPYGQLRVTVQFPPYF